MTTESHVSHAVTPRRTYLIGRARPNAIVGRNRESGEIALIIVGAFLGMMCGLLVPVLSLRIVLPGGLPAARPRRGVRAVQAPHVLQVVRDQPQLQAHPAPGHHLPQHRHGGRHPARRPRGRDRAAAGHRPHQLAGRALRPGRDRRTAARRPAHGDGRDRDRGPGRRPARLRGPGGPRRPLRHPAQARGQRRRLRHPPADAGPHPARRPGRPRQGRRRTRRRRRAALAAGLVRPTAVDGVDQQRAAPRLPRRLHALHPRTGRRGARDGPAARRQAAARWTGTRGSPS